MRRSHQSVVSIALSLLIVLLSGCCTILSTGSWLSPRLTAPDSAILNQSVGARTRSGDLARANIAYSQAVEAMQRGESLCVDHFFQAALSSWRDIQSNLDKPCIHELASAQIYRSSLNALIIQGQHFGRFDPCAGLQILASEGWIMIPSQFYGFARSPEDIRSVVTVGDYFTPQLNNIYRSKGLGVPAVVQCRPAIQSFQRKQTSFVATLILRSSDDMDSSQSQAFALEFHNPLVSESIQINEVSVPMAIDKSAAIARTLITTKRKYVQAFLQPGNVDPDEEGLFMLEPYVAGKIPVILVHGLLSDRLTWSNLVNEIRARPWFNERFQVWGFEYPTGQPFLPSAAKLRTQITQLCGHVDPDDTDQALKRIVLVGHSMGGLISKLQVSSSGNNLWDSIANRRFEEVTISRGLRETLGESLFFEPGMRVGRVVYVGTPHRGSVIANRAVGRIGSVLIKQPENVRMSHQELLAENPNTFSNEFMRRVPNSLDLLEPDSLLLSAIEGLPISAHVDTHSIIGSGRWMPGSGDSDGVVPVSSARQRTADSERFVYEKHSDLTRDPSAIDEVLSILQTHFHKF